MSFDLTFLDSFHSIYIGGTSMCGKTSTVLNYMKDQNKDYTYTRIQDLKSDKDFLNLLNYKNVYHMFFNETKQTKYIIVDDIDILQNNDKKILTFLIKFFKKREYKKYENIVFIFIGNNQQDNKIQELQAVMEKLYFVEDEFDAIETSQYCIKKNVKRFIYEKSQQVQGLKDRNILSLCFHENMVDYVNNNPIIYEKCLYNICIGDFYDRMSFKKQLWQFNEMTFYLKLLCNQKYIQIKEYKNIEFTKILTRFSNQYSNLNFVIALCKNLNIQKEELFFFLSNELPCAITIQQEKRIRKLLY
jgi:glutaredoxin-related protein